MEGDEAAVAEVNEEVGVEGLGGEVVDAARAVSRVAQNEALAGASEGGEDVGENQRVHQEALRQLESHA